MELIEILLIVFCVLVVISVIGSYVYKKIRHLPTGECACCQKKMKKDFNKIRKELTSTNKSH